MNLFVQECILQGTVDEFIAKVLPVIKEIDALDFDTKIAVINALRAEIHMISPFKAEPVDCVRWVPSDDVTANDYNPNSVATPEMKLLEHSIISDGYTQPIVAWRNEDHYEVVDGFHRNRVGKESDDVRGRLGGYLPVTLVNEARHDRGDRIAATIRHNRARGKHRVDAMSDIVVELKRRNWSDEKIGKELGMDPDEVLRLTQITGLAEMFANQDFSAAWDIEGANGIGGELLSDVADEAPATNGRILHTWDKWECFLAGFYEDRPPEGMTQDEGEEEYRKFLSDAAAFEEALMGVTQEWINSCEHYLTNERMNRIAWLGQASMAYAHHIPSCCRGGYNRLTASQKAEADSLALKYLNKWLTTHDRKALAPEEALSKTEADLY